jgi:hypothetical protein
MLLSLLLVTVISQNIANTYEVIGSRTIRLKQTFAINLITFQEKPMHLWLEAYSAEKILLSVKNGARIALAGPGEGLAAGRCDENQSSREGVPVGKIEVGQIYCVWLPNEDLMVGQVKRMDRVSPMALIEIDSRFYRQR